MKLKTQIQLTAQCVGLSLLLTYSFQPSALLAQGSLTPAGSPAPTMKTLAQIEPRTPISMLPLIINSPGSYYLTANLTGISGSSGITIASGNVTLDLNGFTLQGVPGSLDGVFVSGTFTNVIVRNGTVTGWGAIGVDAWLSGFPRNLVFEHLTISGNGARGLYTEAGSIVRDCLFIGNAGDGIYSGGSSGGGDIAGCIARNNGGYGFSVANGTVRQSQSEYNSSSGFNLIASRALECSSQNNNGDGFECNGLGDEIRKCRIVSNSSTGINCKTGNSANVVEDCEVLNNSLYGYYSGNASGNSVISRNHFSLNTLGAIIIQDSNNLIEENHVVTANGVLGIEIVNSANTNNVIIKNVVIGGGLVNFVNYGITNDFGPAGSAAMATSPWANISH